MILFSDIPGKPELKQRRMRHCFVVHGDLLCKIDGVGNTELSIRSSRAKRRVDWLDALNLKNIDHRKNIIFYPDSVGKIHYSFSGDMFRVQRLDSRNYHWGISQRTHVMYLVDNNGNNIDGPHSINNMLIKDLVAVYQMPGANTVEELKEMKKEYEVYYRMDT